MVLLTNCGHVVIEIVTVNQIPGTNELVRHV